MRRPGRVGAGARLGQREGGDDVTGGHRLEPARLLLVGAEPDEHLPGDAVVGAEHRPQRQRRVAEFHRQFDVLGQVQAEAAPLLRDRIAEQPHLLGLLAQVVGYPVVGQDLLLARHDGGADEVTSLGQDLLEILVADFGGGHRRLLLFGEWPHGRQKSYMKYDVRLTGPLPGSDQRRGVIRCRC